MHQNPPHLPVMVDEVAGLLQPVPPGIIVDATLGAGGHTRRLLEVIDPAVSILGLDRDPRSVAVAGELGDRVRFRCEDFRRLGSIVEEEGIDELSGVLFDLGISSMQIDDPARGFSYRRSGPLDMRMGPDGLAAAEVVNRWPVDRLADTIRRFGEERYADRIARAIEAARPLSTTVELAAVVASALPARSRRTGGHPARRTFQAIRIAVNDELGALAEALDAAVPRLAMGGRIVVISYHSLEDRIVKRRLASETRSPDTPPGLPVEPTTPPMRLLTRGAHRPSAAEVAANPRARSARLRAAERMR